MMTHGESRARRAKLAAHVAQGATIGDTAAEFHVSDGTVRQGCHEHGVTWKIVQTTGFRVHPFAVLAELQAGKSLRATGKRCGISYERVRQIKTKAIEYGVLIAGLADD